jgi:hypothetical protein
MFIFAILGITIILLIFVDAFETIILPRRVNRRVRFSRLYYRTFWKLWKKGKHLFKNNENRKVYLGVFGPLSLIILIGIWAIALIFGFALINFGTQTAIQSPQHIRDFLTYFNLSGATFFPMGLPDTYPLKELGKFLAIIESGVGFAFLAMVIGYLPILYQAFSRREVNINLLDSHAGSPPNALYFIQQFSDGSVVEEIKPQLEKWEVWCAELLETHLSYPVLAFYRSQHDDQSWIAALLMILDTSSIVLASKNQSLHSAAKSTLAIARHAAIDLSQSYYLTLDTPSRARLTKKDFEQMKKLLKDSDLPLKDATYAEEKLQYLRKLYEPHIQALSDYFLMPITPFIIEGKIVEAWRKNI